MERSFKRSCPQSTRRAPWIIPTLLHRSSTLLQRHIPTQFPKNDIQISQILLRSQMLQPRLLLCQNLHNLRKTLLVHHRPLAPSPSRGTGILYSCAKSTNKRPQLIQPTFLPRYPRFLLSFLELPPWSLFLRPKGAGSYGRDQEMQVPCKSRDALLNYVCMRIARKSREVTECCVCKTPSCDCSSVSFWMCTADCRVCASMCEHRSIMHDWHTVGLYSAPISLFSPSMSFRGIKG